MFNRLFLSLLLFSLPAMSAEQLTQDIIEFTVMGTGNNVTLNQGVSSQNQNGHSISLYVNGESNTVGFSQYNFGVGTHYINQSIVGNNNTSLIVQGGDNSKQVTSAISGNYNTQHVNQSGSGEHIADITLVGDNNSAGIIQAGDVGNMATIHLENAGGPSLLDLTQQSNVGFPGNEYSVTQICANPAGCAVSVLQTAQ